MKASIPKSRHTRSDIFKLSDLNAVHFLFQKRWNYTCSCKKVRHDCTLSSFCLLVRKTTVCLKLFFGIIIDEAGWYFAAFFLVNVPEYTLKCNRCMYTTEGTSLVQTAWHLGGSPCKIQPFSYGLSPILPNSSYLRPRQLVIPWCFCHHYINKQINKGFNIEA